MPARTTAAQATTPAPSRTLSNERKAFWHSPYTNADAQAVKTRKGLPTLDAAKDFIGAAILGKKEGQLQALGVTRYRFDDHDCLARFERSGFTESDVKQAKKAFPFLKGASTNDVKGYLGLKLRNQEVGYPDGLKMLTEHGITESKYDAHEQLDAFKAGGLSARHVSAAKAQYDFLSGSSDTEVKQYLGLKVLNAKDGYDFAKDFLKAIGATKGWGG